jgi:hypothetical protein
MARRAAPIRLQRIPSGSRRNRIEPSIAEDADLVGSLRAPAKREYVRRQAKPEEAM